MYVRRELEERFLRVSEHYGIAALIGPRQSGKTTMLKNLMKGMDASYVLFDDPDARAIFEEDVKKFRTQYMEGHDLTVLDEIQYCRDAGSKLKYLADTGSRMWITSSSEMLLGKDVLSYLVGRVAILRLYPFSINEFLRAKGQKVLNPQILRRHVWEHISYGGFPGVVMTDSVEMKRTVLANLQETMLIKDVSRTFSIDNMGALERLTRYLALNAGAIISYSKLSDDLKISFQTLKKYLDALVKSYIIVDVPPFFSNRSREISKQPKMYFLDTGLRNAAAGRYPLEPEGRLFENYVLSELVKMGFEPRYWRTKSKAEVDFVVEKEGKIVPVEVKINADLSRIERGLRSFIEKYEPERAFVVSYKGYKGIVDMNGTELVFTDILGMWDMLGDM